MNTGESYTLGCVSAPSYLPFALSHTSNRFPERFGWRYAPKMCKSGNT